ncbi:MAG: polyprenyl synthetase family protein [Candidatus Omnitrophica bacterium]|nr:polyprenyl synthetase family protein [Candidatus Omnitrophota bacterium]
MLNKIKKNIELELVKFIRILDEKYKLSIISPMLHKNLINFLSRPGKRIRPLLFIIGYKGFSNKNPFNLYRSALSVELLHSFLLIHDDILDNSDMRRGQPALHIMLNKRLNQKSQAKSVGMPLALVSGDIIYALSIEAFISIKESPEKKQKALLKLLESGFYTGCGEFIEIINSKKPIAQISRNEIYKTYDYKTAYYTFSAPLITGAILAGASSPEIKKLFKFGKYCGRAFQIKDDILGLFGDSKQTGKSGFTDIKESKKTLLIWHAYNNATPANKICLQKILTKNKTTKSDIINARRILKETKSLRYCLNLIQAFIQKSIHELKTSNLKKTYKKELIGFCQKILEL